MNDFILVLVTISVITGLIYCVYIIILGSGQKEAELQITSKDLMEQLNILRKQKKFSIVETLAKTYLDKKPADNGVRTILAKALHDAGKVYNAIDQAKVIVKNQPLNSDIQLFLANCYAEVDKPMKAIEIYKEVLQHNSENVVALKELAKVYVATNQKKSAIEMYKKLNELLDNSFEKAKIKTTIAEIHLEFADYKPAIKEYEEILEVYPDDIKIQKRLIELYKVTLNYEPLIIMANQISVRDADNENGLWALNMLMDIYRLSGDYPKALDYAEMIRIHPLADTNQLESDIAKIFFHEGKFDSSIELLDELSKKDPENIGIKKELASAYEAKEDFKAATEVYRKIIDLAGVSDVKQIHFELSNLYSNWAMHLFFNKENEECFKKFSTALEYCDENADVYYRLGTINRAIKNFNEAVNQYKKAIDLDTQNAEYHYAISECYEEIDSVYEQKKALIECLKYDPQNAKAHYKYGLILSVQNDEINALEHIQEAANIDDTFIDAKRKLALMLEHIGKKEEAALVYEDILKLEPENEDVLNNLKMLQGG